MRLEAAKKHFNLLIQHKRLAHAYLFTGELNPAKKELVDTITQALVCKHFDAEGRACLNCMDCQRITRGQFADYMTIEPDGRSIKVDQIRGLKEWLGTSPIEADFKIATIEQADLMGPAAANALLLFLEEPSPNVYIFLFSRQAEQLLPTIQSRVQEVILEDDKEHSQIDQMVQAGIRDQHARVMLKLSANRLENLMDDYEAESFEAWLKAIEYFYQLLIQENPYAFVAIQQYLKPYLNYNQGQDGLDYLNWLNAQLLLSHYPSKENHLGSLQKRVNRIKERIDHQMSQTSYHRMNELLMDSKKLLLFNVTPQLAYERLAIKMCEWK
ncbi:DNA polymerase III subunit delta' [Facklamia sp. P13064]|uniref:DNA polymerase III subunit delta' n=1 Tax=Facklamia sp. P13064 TaxID=3421953 RepID=UPI003D168546